MPYSRILTASSAQKRRLCGPRIVSVHVCHQNGRPLKQFPAQVDDPALLVSTTKHLQARCASNFPSAQCVSSRVAGMAATAGTILQRHHHRLMQLGASMNQLQHVSSPSGSCSHRRCTANSPIAAQLKVCCASSPSAATASHNRLMCTSFSL